MVISSSTLRLMWDIIERVSPNDLLSLSDTALIKVLLQHLGQETMLSGEEICELYSYLGANLLLIRDIAESRLSQSSQPLQNFPNHPFCDSPIAETAVLRQ
jgi:hypothetical protein